MNTAATDLLPDLSGLSFHDFESAGQAVLAHLHKRLGFGLWMLSRTVGDRQVVLQSLDNEYGVSVGTTLSWADSFCIHMVKGSGPRVAPDIAQVQAYAAVAIRQKWPVMAYIGVPLFAADGSLFGTLCALDSAVKPASLIEEQDLIELLAGLLGSLLRAELKSADETGRRERLQVEADSDALTQLLNRRGWDRMLAAQDDRCRRYGHEAAVMAIDVDGLKLVNDRDGHAAGDALIVLVAQALRSVVRETDVLARVGGDEFGIIAVDCGTAAADALVERTLTALQARGVRASIGVALRSSSASLVKAWSMADQQMYDAKRARHGA